MLPQARTESDGLIIKPLIEETIIFDIDAKRGICLNAAAMLIWRCCDGATTVPQIAAALAADLGLPNDENLVWAGLETLGRAGLLKACPPAPSGITASVRRRLRRRMIFVAGTAFLSAIIAPRAAEAASLACVPNASGCGGFHAACTKNTNCCSCNCNTSAGKCM